MNEVRSGIWPGSADTHRRVVHVAAVIAAVAALLVFLVGLWAEDPPIMKAAIGPGLAAVFMMIQSVLRLEPSPTGRAGPWWLRSPLPSS